MVQKFMIQPKKPQGRMGTVSGPAGIAHDIKNNPEFKERQSLLKEASQKQKVRFTGSTSAVMNFLSSVGNMHNEMDTLKNTVVNTAVKPLSPEEQKALDGKSHTLIYLTL